MAKHYNLARVTSATTGTGTITLGAAVPGFLTFAQAGVGNGDVVVYGIQDGTNSEVGTGTYTAAGTTLTRTPITSTNANAAINLSGSAQVFITAIRESIGNPTETNTWTGANTFTAANDTVLSATATGGTTRRTLAAHLGDVLYVEDFGALGNGTADDFAAIQAAIDYAVSLNGATVRFGAKEYKFTQTLTVAGNAVRLEGDGQYATRLKFAPTVDNDVAIAVGSATSMYSYGGITHLALWSDDTAFTKTAIQITDVDGYELDDVLINGAYTGLGSLMWGGAGSIGVQTRGGHDFIVIRENCRFAANKPLVISPHPTTANLGADHCQFSAYLVADGFPCVTVESGAPIGNSTFRGAWAGGTYGFYWADTATSIASINLRFESIRTEQAQDANGYSIYISPNNSLQTCSIENCYFGMNRKGIYVRKCTNLSIKDMFYSGGSEALNIDGTVWHTTFVNCLWPGSPATFSMVGQKVNYKSAPAAGSPVGILPSDASYSIYTADFDATVKAATIPPGTGTTGRLLSAHLGDTLYVDDFGAKGDGATDDAAAIQACIDALIATGEGGIVRFGPKGYVIKSTLSITHYGITLEGEGKYTTILSFDPQVDNDIAIDIQKPGAPHPSNNILNWTQLRGFTLYSANTSFSKTAVQATDVDYFEMDHVAINGAVSGVWGDTKPSTTGSIGVRLRGRDFITIRDTCQFAAQRPVIISVNPNITPPGRIDFDHSSIAAYLSTTGAFNCITVDDSVYLSNATFTGAWVLGAGHGFSFEDTTGSSSISACSNVKFTNLRGEGADDNTKYSIYFSPRLCNGVTIENTQFAGGCKGVFLRKCTFARIENCLYTSLTLEGLNVDATVNALSLENNFWQTGSTATMTGQNLVYKGPNNPSTGPLPGTALYSALTASPLFSSPAIREKLTANRTYYVRTNGLDTNDGLSNVGPGSGGAGAFLTIGKAIAVVQSIDLSIYDVTIQCGGPTPPSTFNESITIDAPWTGQGTVTIQGDTTTPSNVVWNAPSGACLTVSGVANLSVAGFKFTAAAAYGSIFSVNAPTNLTISGNIEFGQAGIISGGQLGQHIFVTSGASYSNNNAYSITGVAANHIWARGGKISNYGAKTLSGTQAYSIFARSDQSGYLDESGAYTGGTITGVRFQANNNGLINTYGGGANVYPGNSTGTCQSGGIYQ